MGLCVFFGLQLLFLKSGWSVFLSFMISFLGSRYLKV